MMMGALPTAMECRTRADAVVRVAHFIGTNFVGGPEKQLLSHTARLHALGHQAMFISFAEPGGRALQQAAERLGAETVLLPAGKWQLLGVLRALLDVYDAWRPAVGCAHGYKAGFYALLLKLARGCRVIGFSRGWTFENLKVRLYGWIDRAVIRFADKVVAVSQSQRRRLIRALVPAGKIEVIENAVTLLAAGDAEVGADMRQELGLDQSAVLLLAAGRLSPEKGFDDLLRATAKLVRTRPQIHLLLAGAGDLGPALRGLAGRLDCRDHVHFLGFRTDMQRLFRQSNAYVLSSHTEGMPNVLLEAMALGVPVVATRVGGVPEIVEHEVSGLLVPAQRPAELAAAVGRLLDDPPATQRMVATAQRDVRLRFHPDKQTQRLLELYRSVARPA